MKYNFINTVFAVTLVCISSFTSHASLITEDFKLKVETVTGMYSNYGVGDILDLSFKYHYFGNTMRIFHDYGGIWDKKCAVRNGIDPPPGCTMAHIGGDLRYFSDALVDDNFALFDIDAMMRDGVTEINIEDKNAKQVSLLTQEYDPSNEPRPDVSRTYYIDQKGHDVYFNMNTLNGEFEAAHLKGWTVNDLGIVSETRLTFSLIKTNEVPEPSTLVIFALGVMGLASRRLKKQS